MAEEIAEDVLSDAGKAAAIPGPSGTKRALMALKDTANPMEMAILPEYHKNRRKEGTGQDGRTRTRAAGDGPPL